MLLATSLSGETPQGQNRASDLVVVVLCAFRVVLVVIELLFITVLDDHSLHDL
jgi:hypothetical protein